ncbi:MAG: crossover junction endodeoxyribonuclease RuvC [Propionibacteriaceae bacterium]
MGIDPGLTRCGVGIVEGRPGAKPTLIGVGVIRTPPDLAHERRLLAIDEGLEEWLVQFQPERIAVERVFAQHNLHSVVGTAQAAGIGMLVGARHSLPVALHTPSEVKAAISGSGRADKAQVGAMVARILGLSEPPKPADAADAVALAITQVWRGGTTSRYQEAALAAAPLNRTRTKR